MLEIEKLTALVIEALEDVKATDIRILDVRDKSSFTDVLVIASGNTSRQVKALVNSVVVKAKEAGINLTVLKVSSRVSGHWLIWVMSSCTSCSPRSGIFIILKNSGVMTVHRRRRTSRLEETERCIEVRCRFH